MYCRFCPYNTFVARLSTFCLSRCALWGIPPLQLTRERCGNRLSCSSFSAWTLASECCGLPTCYRHRCTRDLISWRPSCATCSIVSSGTPSQFSSPQIQRQKLRFLSWPVALRTTARVQCSWRQRSPCANGACASPQHDRCWHIIVGQRPFCAVLAHCWGWTPRHFSKNFSSR